VWAWRTGRIQGIAQAEDLVLCLLPFEAAFYAQAAVHAEFVGHPLADEIPLEVDAGAARRALGLAERSTVAILPGSRHAEVARLGADFAATIAWLRAQRRDLQFVAPMASAAVRAQFEQALKRHAGGVEVLVLDGQSHLAMAAADAVLVASGTATLETLLSQRPMVVAYRVAPFTAWLARRLKLMKVSYFSHPNLLAGRHVVPEFFQEQVTPQALGFALLRQLDNPEERRSLARLFAEIHVRLRRNASARAAEAVLSLLVGESAAVAGAT
jgi:lipid-A-disaccharide synthase